MPDYETPGVYVEETTFRSRSIHATPLTLALFLGVLPDVADPQPREVTSWQDFRKHFGEAARIRVNGRDTLNHMLYAANAYFQNGGRRMLVAPVARVGDAEPDAADYSAALAASLAFADITLVHAPGAATWTQREAIEDVLVAHVDHTPGRFLVLDPPPAQDLAQVRAMRARLHTAHAALYYPWIVANDIVRAPDAPTVLLAPGGFVCGIYMRCDTQWGVQRAPVNETIIGALGFEVLLNKQQQNVLNPEGINCLRYFEGRGRRVWGARTLASDPEWKYINGRRVIDYLQRSIARGTEWTVFEPNGQALWSNLRAVIEDFLLNEWHKQVLLGATPAQAYFVRCDGSTMSQNDLDNGRLVCQIGVALARPAEFTIFRLSQSTADAAG